MIHDIISILLSPDKSINEDEIKNYIEMYGIDARVFNNIKDADFPSQSLLEAIVSNPDIDEATKLALVEKLIAKGADARFANINFAVYKKNIPLANLLISHGAMATHSGDEGNLIDIALALKDHDILQWVMVNAHLLFWKLKNR